MNTSRIQRRYDLDWLRVAGILTVFIYHSTRFFNIGDWHVKNAITYASIGILQKFLESWMMPLMFLISGASIFYAMGKSGAGKFFKDKFLRIGVPLLVGVFTHASLQVYLERLTHGQFSGSYFEFLPHYFEGIYIDTGVGGNFAAFGMHLWYLFFLFVYIVLLYPLFRWLVGSGQRALKVFCDFLALPGTIYLLSIPVFIFFDAVEDTPSPGGWPLPAYISFVLAGFVMVSHQRLQDRIRQMRWISLAGAAFWVIVYAYLASETRFAALFDDLNGLLYCLAGWFLLLAFLGFASRHLNFTTPFLQYANEAVLPFYILHQTVLLVVGFYIVRWPLPDLLKWVLIASVSFLFIMGLYEGLVRRVNLLRFLFGMKLLPQRAPVRFKPAIPAAR